MKVLFLNRPKNIWTGGDYFQMEKTAGALRELGHEVDIVEVFNLDFLPDTSGYNIVHTFNFSMGWSRWLLSTEKRPNQKFFASMLYHELDSFISYPDQQKMYDKLDGCFFLTKEEEGRLERHIKTDRSKHYLVPNGIDEFWFRKQLPFLDPRKRNYVLSVGRNDAFKGQHFVADACEMLGVRFVSIGGTRTIKRGKYWQLADMPQKDLVKWYANCSVFVLASQNELMPLTVMEAGAQAKNIVLTNGCGWEIPETEYVTYGNVVEIVNAIKKSLNKKPNYVLQDMLRGMTWAKTGEQINNIYEK